MISKSIKKKHTNSDYSGDQSIEEEESFSNLSAYARREKLRKHRLKKQRIYKKKTHGSWNKEEEQNFIDFMRLKREIFESKELRRSERIFCQMTKFLKSRSSEQCRSHYQKYELKFLTFDNIVAHIEDKIMNGYCDQAKNEQLAKQQLVKLEENVKVEEKTRTSKPVRVTDCEVVESCKGVNGDVWSLIRKNAQRKNTYQLIVNFDNLFC